MDTQSKFVEFLESLKTSGNTSLIEAITQGFYATRSLYESPEYIRDSERKRTFKFWDADAYAFVYLDKQGVLYLSSKAGESHDQMTIDAVKAEQPNHPGVDFWDLKSQMGFGYDDDSERVGYLGRFWLKSKVISFWRYPDAALFQTILSSLKDKGVGIDNTWRVEVYLPDSEATLDRRTTLIPIDDYAGQQLPEKQSKLNQEDLDMLRELHTMDPIAKAKLPKKEVPTKDLKLGEMSMAEYNNQKRKGSD